MSPKIKFICSQSQIPEFKSSVKLLFKGIHLCTEQELLRGNKPLNLAAKALGYDSFSHLSVVSKGHQDPNPFRWRYGHCRRLASYIPKEISYADSELIMSIIWVLDKKVNYESDEQFKSEIMNKLEFRKSAPPVSIAPHISALMPSMNLAKSFGLGLGAAVNPFPKLATESLMGETLKSYGVISTQLENQIRPFQDLPLSRVTGKLEKISTHLEKQIAPTALNTPEISKALKNFETLSAHVGKQMEPLNSAVNALKISSPMAGLSSMTPPVRFLEKMKEISEPLRRLQDRLGQEKLSNKSDDPTP